VVDVGVRVVVLITINVVLMPVVLVLLPVIMLLLLVVVVFTIITMVASPSVCPPQLTRAAPGVSFCL
jgi:hypothetical protein